MNNNFVINITKSDRANLEELPEITIYQTESGQYCSSDVEVLINAIALVSDRSKSIVIAARILPISERTRKVK